MTEDDKPGANVEAYPGETPGADTEPASEAGAGHPAEAASRQAVSGVKVDAALLREVIKIQPFTRWTGVEILKAEDGVVETRLVLRPEDMTQHHGFLHGGLVGFLADNAAAYAAATLVGDVVTSQFSLNFLAPGIGEAFRARAHVVKAGKRQVTVRVDVIAEQGDKEKLIAVAQATITPVG
jgi:uncharacterized protein (TIGR00369 family)